MSGMIIGLTAGAFILGIVGLFGLLYAAAWPTAAEFGVTKERDIAANAGLALMVICLGALLAAIIIK